MLPTPFAMLFTGLSGSGKTTLAQCFIEKYKMVAPRCILHLDGDEYRKSLCKDLGFSDKDRKESLKRAGYAALLALQSHIPVVISAIAPHEGARVQLKNTLSPVAPYFEIYVHASLAQCEKRDVKGLYRQARQGELMQFTGIQSDYQAPSRPDLIINSENEVIANSIDRIIQLLTAVK